MEQSLMKGFGRAGKRPYCSRDEDVDPIWDTVNLKDSRAVLLKMDIGLFGSNYIVDPTTILL